MIHNKPDENWMKLSDLKLLQFVHSMLSTSKMIRLVVMVTSCWALCTYTLVQYPFQDVFLHNQGQMDKQSFKAPIPSKAWQRTVSIEQDDTFSACLLVMDDNHFLVEWLAYHYYALPLRYLVVAVDPRSQTSPTPILDRYRNKEDGMTIIEWTDEDYMNDEELIEAEQKVRNQFGNLTSTLVRHRARQRLFYYKCMQKMKEEDRTWTLMTDTDEFLRVNYDNVKDTGLEEYGRIPRISEPASIRSVLHAELERPNTNLTKTPCIQIPRLRFGAVTSGKAPTGMLPEGWDNTDNFLTLFWRKHAGAEQYWANKISKVMIDVSQVNWEELVPVESIHRPIKSLCNKRKLHVRANESPLVINHYLGSYEQYVYRNDARQDEKKEGRTRAQYVKQKRLDAETDDDIRPWLKGFVKNEGYKEAKQLLDGVGVLQPKSEYDNAFMPELGEKERCAILLFGLPRSFKDMVLPSLKKNLLAPNARYNCDYFVHYYYRTEEPEGRANSGGKLDPNEILQLEKAVKDIAAATTTKAHNHTPTVSFHSDTEEDFWSYRNDTIQKYRNTKAEDGNYLYFPWEAKSYYYPSSLDNIVRQWHSISSAWEMMEQSAAKRGVRYTRVGMFRSDVMYVTPSDIYQTDRESYDRTSSKAMLAPFGAMPVNDRMFYGPHDAVEIWATKRFEFLENYVQKEEARGWAMHSEKFLAGAIMPAVRDLGIDIVVNPDICFLRTRADYSAVTTDCQLMGTTRDFEDKDMKAVVESIVERRCSDPYKVTAAHISVQCEPDADSIKSKRLRRRRKHRRV